MQSEEDLYVEIRRDGSGLRADGHFIPFILPGERPDAIISVPWESRKVPGSVMRSCSSCGMAISLAPSSQQILQEYPDVPVYCTNCAHQQIKEETEDSA